MKVAVLGGTGWIGLQVVNYLISSKAVSASDIIVTNATGDFSALSAYPRVICTTDNQAAIDQAGIVFLSVRPQVFGCLNIQIKNAWVVSVMAGVQIETIERIIGSHRIVRSMPNAAIEVGESMTPWFATDAITAEEKVLTQKLLQSFGQAVEVVNEDQLNYLTALSGSGHGTIAYFQAAMVKAAENYGLPYEQAQKIVQQVFTGNSLLMQRGYRDAIADVKEVIEYAGTTAALCTKLNELGVDQRIAQAVEASYQKASSNMND